MPAVCHIVHFGGSAVLLSDQPFELPPMLIHKTSSMSRPPHAKDTTSNASYVLHIFATRPKQTVDMDLMYIKSKIDKKIDTYKYKMTN